MTPLRVIITLLVTVITSTLSSPLGDQREQRAKWLEAMGLANEPGVYVGPGLVDLESSGDFPSDLPGGLQGSGDQPPVETQEQDFDITDLLIAVDHQKNEESFIPSSSSSLSSSSIVEASVSEYDGLDSEEDVRIEEDGKYEGGNELGMGGLNDLKPVGAIDHDLDPNAIPDAFQHGANAELGPDTNHVSTRAKASHPEKVKPGFKQAEEGEKATISGQGKTPPNVLKYTAVIGVVMVAGAVGMGALLSAAGVAAVKLVKRIRKPAVVEA